MKKIVEQRTLKKTLTMKRADVSIKKIKESIRNEPELTFKKLY